MTELQLPDGVYAVTRRQAMEILGIKSRSTIAEYQDALNDLSPPLWDYQEMGRGFSRNSLICLMVLRELVKKMGKKQAAKQLPIVLKDYENNG